MQSCLVLNILLEFFKKGVSICKVQNREVLCCLKYDTPFLPTSKEATITWTKTHIEKRLKVEAINFPLRGGAVKYNSELKHQSL